MEVHHHAHTARKKWTHYFWEFLMLFLAVFCGFLAENKREHMIEHQREKRLAKNLYKEVLQDSISLSAVLEKRELKERDCAWFINYVKDSSLTNLSHRFFPATTRALIQNQFIIFDPNDGVLSQLRNSGELRYFRNSDLQTAIGNLGVRISYMRTRNDKEYSYVELYIRPFLLKHFDFDWYEQFSKNGSITILESLAQDYHQLDPGKLVNVTAFRREEAQAIASYFLLMMRATRQVQYKEFSKANHHVLELLRKEYKFK